MLREERKVELKEAKGKDPKRTWMRTLGDDIRVLYTTTGCAT